VYRLQEIRPEVSVFWVHASNVERFCQSYASIAEECQIPGYDDPKMDVLPLVRRWLNREDRGQWLMVIDNADDTQLFFSQAMGHGTVNASSHNGNLGQYIPECSHGSILVTTRNKEIGSRLRKGKYPIQIGMMDVENADQLLRAKFQGGDLDLDSLSALSSRLERLPLALVQAAAYIQEKSISISDYIGLLGERDQDLVDYLSEEFETDGRDSETPRAVAETWILSFEQIQRQNGFAAELLSLMSFFDRQAIPMEFLASYANQQTQERCCNKQLTDAVGVLKAFSFVTSGKDESLDVHRLVQLVSRNWLMRENKKEKEHFTDQALLAVSHAYPFGNYENWATCRRYLPHAYAVLEFKGTGSKDEEVARASLLLNVAWFLQSQGQWKDAERLQVEAVNLRRNIFGADHPYTLTSMAWLASTFIYQGRWEEAGKLGVQVMETRKAKLGDDHPDTLTSMANLASTYWNQGRLEEAEKLEVQVMETRKAKLGDDHPDTLTSMGKLAFTWEAQGRLTDALSLMCSCASSRQRILGPRHPETLSSLAALDDWRRP